MIPAPADPAVSVLLPVRSPAPYLDEALESIRAQSEQDWEIVLVLDGPADRDVGQVLSRFNDSRLRVTELPGPSGLAGALNAGLAVCRGRYVARMDADDVSLPERLAVQLRRLEQDPQLGLLGGRAEVVDAEGGHLGWRGGLEGHDAISRTLLWRNTFVHPSVMFRRDLVATVGGYDPRVVRLEDWELWLRLLGRTKMANLPDVLVKYRVHGGQHSLPRRFQPIELAVMRQSRDDAAARLGRSSTGSAARHVIWVLYQRAVHARSLLARRTAA